MPFDAETIDEIRAVAERDGIEPAALLAVAEVESGGRAHTTIDGARLPVILYEYHVFHRNLPAALRAGAVRRGLACRRWGELPYERTQRGRYAQLAAAGAIHEEAAHMACSWGIGQVLGENAVWLGYPSAVALAEEAKRGVAGQVDVMLRFVRGRRLEDELAARDWAGFARIYNGPGQVAHYSRRLAAAYRRHGGRNAPAADPVSLRAGSSGAPVSALQRRLNGLGFDLDVDGDFGPATRDAVRRFQRDRGLAADGIAGPRTLARIASETTSAVPAGA